MAGIYVHIPFCKSRCKYCDFYSTTLLDRRPGLVNAVAKEWKMRREELTEPIRTIYFGGGTPSLLEAEDIQTLLSTFTDTKIGPADEITLEANPGDLNYDRLTAFRQVGVNRLSIGIQSFQDSLLHTIGRRHNARQAIETVVAAQKAGFTNLSIDLMYGLPNQTMEQWKEDIHTALGLNIQHISCYCLSYEEGTLLSQLRDRSEVKELDDDTLNMMYDTLCDELTGNGFQHYEVSNFALPGYHSRHNSSYWNNTPYIGLGPAAHSYDGKTRSWNISDLDSYIAGIQQNRRPYEYEELSADECKEERIMLGLRTMWGIKKEWVADKLPVVNKYVENGLLSIHDEQITATQKGLHILNRIIEDLI